jgi:hypothetical protein
MSSALLDLVDFLAAPAAREDPSPPPAGPVESMRLLLAVRGWVEPNHLLPADVHPEAALRTFQSLAWEVETAIQTRPGQWFLSVDGRKQALKGRTREVLRKAAGKLHPGDEEDPVRKAFLIALQDEEPNLSKLDSSVLSILDNVRDWLGDQWGHRLDTAQIAAALASRSLDANLEKLTRQPMVGAAHKHILDRLLHFCSDAQKGNPNVSISYVYGTGGSGKTTLLAFLQRSLRARMPVVRIDFDEPSVDARRMVTLNLALCEQLADTVPGMAGTHRILRSQASLQSQAGLSRVGHGSSDVNSRLSQSYQRYSSESESDSGSILGGMFHSLPGPLALIFDTAELVMARSDAESSALASWVRFLATEGGAQDIRIVVAGRDPLDAGEAGINLVRRLERDGAAVQLVAELPELSPIESAELLRNCGVDDEVVIRQAATAVPGNPLLLRITGEALRNNDGKLREAVHEAHRQSRIDSHSAHNYLMRRIVAHVSDPYARPYVLAATVSPLISKEFIEAVVIPFVDRQAPQRERGQRRPAAGRSSASRDASRVFNSLAGTHWLTRMTTSAEGWVAFDQDMRAFALKLLAATDGGADQLRKLRQTAAKFHERRDSETDRALAFYQQSLLGLAPKLPPNREIVRGLLQGVLHELSDDLRRALEGEEASAEAGQPWKSRSQSSARRPSASNSTPQQWQRYLEGDEKGDGEGAKLVEADKAREALELYDRSPTRPDGHPPTFILQALADLGEWDSGLANIESIVGSEGDAWLEPRSLRPPDLSRIYWTTRLAMLAGNGRLSPSHAYVLRRVSSDARAAKLTALAELVGVAEAISGERIMEEPMRSYALRQEATPRVVLTAWMEAVANYASLEVGDLAVAQTDWWKRIERWKHPFEGWQDAFSNKAGINRLQRVQAQIDGLAGEPMAQVNLTFGRLKERIEVVPSKLRKEQRVLLLRGQTIEFHRPLREALLVYCADRKAGPLVRSVFYPTLVRMSIWPAEMNPETFFRRIEANPHAWCTAFVSFADRCRLLPSLCESLLERNDNAKARRVASSFLAWDRAIGDGHQSDWFQTESQAPA